MNRTKILLLLSFISMIVLYACNSIDQKLSPEKLVGTTWVNNESNKQLEFISTTEVVVDQKINGQYTIDGEIVTIGNAIVKIPLTYDKTNETLTGKLEFGKPDMVLYKK